MLKLLDNGPVRNDAQASQQIRRMMQEAEQKRLETYKPALQTLASLQELKTATPAARGQVVLALGGWLCRMQQANVGGWDVRRLTLAIFKYLLRGQLQLSGPDQLQLLQQHPAMHEPLGRESTNYPFSLPAVLTQLDKMARKQGLPAEVAAYLAHFLEATGPGTGYHSDPDSLEKTHAAIRLLLDQADGALPTLVFADDHLGRTLSAFAQGLDPAAPATAPWLQLLQLWQQANGTQATAKLQKAVAAVQATIGEAALREQARTWLVALAGMELEDVTSMQQYSLQRGRPDGNRRLLVPTVPVAKGLIWLSQTLADDHMLQQLARLAVTCYQPGIGTGMVAGALGNACLHALAQHGLAGVTYLARLRPKIRHTSIQELLAQYIAQVAQALGVTVAEIEDMSVPDFGLRAGRLTQAFPDGYTATLALAAGKMERSWTKAGKLLKATPAALRTSHADDLAQLKSTLTQAQQTYTAQRERLDRSLVAPRRLAWPWFEQYYFSHGLLSELVRPLIWRLHRPDGSWQDALWLQGQWQGAQGQPLPPPDQATEMQLWHPVLAPVADVLAWRALLDRHELRQPFKQAYREVYLLTPPEEQTNTYSNRMAAHILRQHQFNVLARQKGWKYTLLMAVNRGSGREVATLPLPALGLEARLWAQEVDVWEAWSEAMVWTYVSTDQLSFERAGEAVPLPEVPPQVFSEVMRDVDLFVGVASVGNDPTWRDTGGVPAYRPYWESYSFGELGEVAKNRRLALQRLVPRLKIGPVSTLTDRFLVVRGKRRTYKIHLGSGNILMEPNDQYLCIVPDKSKVAVGEEGVFLPFEGDAVLSIILSKALLLMDDDKITDDTINLQIGHAIQTTI